VIALLGNPNSGKTTLFNALTGSRARVGNYPGITVEHREAVLELGGGARARVIDLPGTYSLVPRAEDEAVAVNGLLGRLPGIARPTVLVAVVDATNLERNLYMVELLRELEVPFLVALTMMDTVEADGARIDVALLASRLGVPVFPVSAPRKQGLDALRQAMVAALGAPVASHGTPPVGASEEVRELGRMIAADVGLRGDPGAIGLWALGLKSGRADEHISFSPAVRNALAQTSGAHAVQQAVVARYQRVAELLVGVQTRDAGSGPTRSEQFTARVDAVVLHPIVGPLLLLLIFGSMFQALFTWSKPIMDGIQAAMHWVGDVIAGWLPAGFPLLRSLLVDGVIGGVGNVVTFVPQIAVLFFCLGVLEDSGYLARAAFLLDRLLSRVGLHGRAFVPMLSGFACGVPAIMAARTIESRKDRLVTILVTPLVSCSARLPVYGLMIATVFATQPLVFGLFHPGAVIMIGMYTLSLVAAFSMAAVFKRTILRSPSPPFVLELPLYRRPRFVPLARHVWSKLRAFLKDAGTVILAITIVLWGLFNFPRSAAIEAAHEKAREQVEKTVTDSAAREEALAGVEAKYGGQRLEYSIAGRIGHAIEPAIRPMGWDWKVGVGIIASFAAREVLVSTLGLVYGLGEGAEEHPSSLQQAMQKDRDPVTGKPVHTPLSGLSLMVFFVLAMQCASTLAVVRRETGSWKWPAFQFAYMTVLAVAGALIVFQGGRLLGFS
jgi:ferrous iron transport protein B